VRRVEEHGNLYGKLNLAKEEISLDTSDNSIRKGINPVNDNMISLQYRQFQQ
jgi:hypothetical protein